MLFITINKCYRSKYSTVSNVYDDFDWKMNNLVYSIAVKWYLETTKMPKTFTKWIILLHFLYIFLGSFVDDRGSFVGDARGSHRHYKRRSSRDKSKSRSRSRSANRLNSSQCSLRSLTGNEDGNWCDNDMDIYMVRNATREDEVIDDDFDDIGDFSN